MLTEQAAHEPGQPDLIRALALIDLVAGQPAQAIAGLDQVLASQPGRCPCAGRQGRGARSAGTACGGAGDLSAGAGDVAR